MMLYDSTITAIQLVDGTKLINTFMYFNQRTLHTQHNNNNYIIVRAQGKNYSATYVYTSRY